MEHLIGVPYDKMNCWQACQRYYKDVLGLNLDYNFTHDTDDKNLNCSFIKSNKVNFKKVDIPKQGDLIVIKILGVECHLAVYLGNGLIFHTTRKTGSVVDRLPKWFKMVEGYYRHGSI